MKHYYRTLDDYRLHGGGTAYNSEALEQGVRIPPYHEIWIYQDGDEEATIRDWEKLMRAVYAPESSAMSLQTWFPGLIESSSSHTEHTEGSVEEGSKAPDASYLKQEILTRSDFDSSAMFFITQRSTLVGSAIALAPPSSEESEIKWLSVHPEHRRNGVGTALLDLCCNYLSKKCGRNRVMIEIGNDHEDAHNFLLHHGFKETDEN